MINCSLNASTIVVALSLLSNAAAATVAPHAKLVLRKPAATSNKDTSITFLYQNNLNTTDDANHVGALLLDPMKPSEASAACEALGESLLPKETLTTYADDFAHQLAYQAYAGRAEQTQMYIIQGGMAVSNAAEVEVQFASTCGHKKNKLPVLCTQSGGGNLPSTSSATESTKVTVRSGSNTFVGYRNQKSFRFLGIPYADAPKRFEYTSVYSGKGETIDATQYGATCAAGSSGSEDCLFLNIQTPYIPKATGADKKKPLRPVHFWIHGGGFTGGAGSDTYGDGGQLASREDVVAVSFNYRLSTLGFLAVPGTDVKGNYGIADQIVALEWTIKNIANFGGDPNQITINGGSAGAGSVRALLGSPKAIGKYQGAIAMSNLGGGENLGLDGNYATTYSAYITAEEGMGRYGNLFDEAGCGSDSYASAEDQIACLKAVDATTLVSLPSVARYVVQDGTVVNTPELRLKGQSDNTAHVPVIFGITRDDGSSFTNYPSSPVSSLLEGIMASIGIDEANAQSIIDSGLFPQYDSGNLTLDAFNVSQRVGTDNQFRCVDQATVYAGAVTNAFERAYYYQLDRTDGGYDPNGLGGPAATAEHPLGDPDLPYFRLHGGDPAWIFGYLSKIRNADDLYSVQLSLDLFGAFIRTGTPQIADEYLTATGYERTKEALDVTGPWEAVDGKDGPIRVLDYPGAVEGFVDVEQCEWLGYGLEYYM